MDNTLSVGSGATIGTAETETPEQPTGTGDAVPEKTQADGGGSKETADNGQEPAETGRKRWSIQDEVKELRAQRRELREQVASSDQVREELRQLREQLNRQAQAGTVKTPANFFVDPEARLQALRDEIRDEIAVQNRGLMDAFHQTREQEYAEQALNQERVSAVEFIRSQKGYDPQDDEDLAEIIGDIPNIRTLSPSFVAEYAWMKLQQQRGISDRSSLKRQAAGVQGQPPGVGFGAKRWSQAEFDAALNQVEKAPHDPKNSELIKELESAHKEGRVK